jgi:hypothetical protein
MNDTRKRCACGCDRLTNSTFYSTSINSRIINALASLVVFDNVTAEDVRGESWRVKLHDNRPIDIDALKTALRKEGLFFGGIVDGDLMITTSYWLRANTEFRQDID